MLHKVLALLFLVLSLCGSVHASQHKVWSRRSGTRHRRHHAQINLNSTVATFSHRSLVERAPPSGWAVYTKAGNDGGGCYVDSSSSRILTGYSGNDASNGLQSCLNGCQAKGFTYGGVQYGTQCYCGNSLPSNLVSAPASECNSPCRTATSDKCGGTWRMNVYTFVPGVTVSGYALQGCVTDGSARALTGHNFYSGRMTARMCVDECSTRGFALAGVQYGSWTMSLYSRLSTTPTTPTLPPSWTYTGCTLDTSSNRVLQLQSSSGGMTVATCLANCGRLGTKYAGVEYGTECYCGNVLNGGSRLEESRCNTACGGGGSSGCGGSWALSVYQNSAASSSVSASPSATPPSSSSPPSGWTYVQCGTDSDQRALTGATFLDETGMTVSKCLSFCAERNFKIGGVEVGAECWCGNALQNNQGKKVSDGECSSACRGDGSQGRCGGDWRISFFSTLTGSALSSAFGTSTSTSTTAASTATPTPGQTGSYTPTISIPGSGTKYVWAHFIVGNSYPYTYDTWMKDIRLASASGIDGFALNLGPDSWQPDRIRDAYNAAAASGTGFKMMLSYDIAEFNCGDGSRIGLFQQYLRDFLYHPAAAKVNGKSAVTTFMGQDCTFGQGSTNNGWATIFGSNAGNIYFMPAYTSDPRGLGAYNIQAEVNWGSAWPEGANEINLDRDNWFITQLNPTGKKYVGTVSPLFASHMSYKNFIWRGDNWLLAQKFEQMISIRDRVDQLELISWNDYGESSYIGPIGGDMPPDVRHYVNDKFPHEDILSLVNFYSTAWRTGRWPAITQDKIWLMARPHARYGSAGGYGPPAGREYTQDNFYAQVHLTGDASVTLCAGACSTQQGKAGINRFSQPLTPGQGVSVEVRRNGQVTARLSPAFTFQANSDRYNFNYLIKSS